MKIAITTCWSLAAIIAGYFAVCCYLRGASVKAFWQCSRRLSKNRLFYLGTGLLVCAVMIVMFQATYRMRLLPQMRLLSLVLVILPTAAVDLRRHKMPNQFLIAGLAIRLILLVFEFLDNSRTAWANLKDCLIGAAVYGVFFLILLLAFKNSVGMGDVKLFALMGLYQGLWGAFSSVFFSLLACFVLSLVLLISKKKGRKDVVAFGPCILIGTVISICLSGM